MCCSNLFSRVQFLNVRIVTENSIWHWEKLLLMKKGGANLINDASVKIGNMYLLCHVSQLRVYLQRLLSYFSWIITQYSVSNAYRNGVFSPEKQ